MPRREDTLIAQIEEDALNSDVPVASALRKCIVLGGKSGSETLRDWATRELQGYGPQHELPDYRVVAAPIMVDGIAGNYAIRGQQFAPSALPDFVQEHISEKVQLRDGVGGIEALLKQTEIKLGLPMGSDLARVMNDQNGNPYQHIISIYWSVSHAAIEGVLDQIRTALTQLVAELRASMNGEQGIPSAEVANQAVGRVVTGKRARVSVTTAQATGNQTSATATVSDNSSAPARSGFWTLWRKLGAFIVGSATVAGTIIAILQLH